MSKKFFFLSAILTVATFFVFMPGQSVTAFLKNNSLLISPIFKEEENIGQNIPPLAEKVEGNLLSIPLITQAKNLSCEAASIKMILAYLGKDVPEEEIQAKFPKNPNPYKGFRGNVNGKIWGFGDYGTYADVVARTFRDYGIPARAYYNLSSETLKEMVLQGKPAIVWVNIANPNPKIRQLKLGQDKVKLISGEHTVVVTGFSDNRWILNDPWRRTASGQRISEVVTVYDLDDIYWDWFDHMAVVVD